MGLMALTHHRENTQNLKSVGMWKEEVLAFRNHFRWLDLIITHHSFNSSLHATPWRNEKDRDYPAQPSQMPEGQDWLPYDFLLKEIAGGLVGGMS